ATDAQAHAHAPRPLPRGEAVAVAAVAVPEWYGTLVAAAAASEASRTPPVDLRLDDEPWTQTERPPVHVQLAELVAEPRTLLEVEPHVAILELEPRRPVPAIIPAAAPLAHGQGQHCYVHRSPPLTGIWRRTGVALRAVVAARCTRVAHNDGWGRP